VLLTGWLAVTVLSMTVCGLCEELIEVDRQKQAKLKKQRAAKYVMPDGSTINPFNANWSKLLLFEGFSAVLV